MLGIIKTVWLAILLLVNMAFTTGCAPGFRLYVGGEVYDEVEEKRVTKEKSMWERFVDGYGKK